MINIYEKYAKVLINYSLELKKGDKLMISGSYLAEPLLKEVYKEALNVGAHPEFRIIFNGEERILYEYASEEQLKYISPITEYTINHYDSFLNIKAPFNLKATQTADREKKKIRSMARKDLNQTFMQRAAKEDLLWTLCEFPTDAQAQECGFSKEEYEDFVFSSCKLYSDDPVAEWKKLSKKQQTIVDFLNGKEVIKFLGNDIDITFSAKGRKWINSDGKCNMPSGEVFTTPVEDSINGNIRFSFPGIFMGEEIEDIRLTVKDGEVVEWDAQKGKELLDKVFEIPGARRFGEAAIGNNYDVTQFTKNMLFDEKIGGTIHMAVGAAYPETGGTNESSIHWDLLADMRDGGEIYADEELIYKDGKFLI